jgi:hypothetical protein
MFLSLIATPSRSISSIDMFHLLPDSVLALLLSYVTRESSKLRSYSAVSRIFYSTIQSDGLWQGLCRYSWLVTEERFKQWPALSSYEALYSVLQKWGPLEGFYQIANAFPWGMLVLLRFFRFNDHANIQC